MEVINNDGGNGKGQIKEEVKTQEPVKKTHEEQLIEFSGRLNEILKDGYSLTAVIQVLDTALFEFRMSFYMQQMEMMERQRQAQKHIEIPHMTIPTNKRK